MVSPVKSYTWRDVLKKNAVLRPLERSLLGFGHVADGLVGRNGPGLSGPHQNRHIVQTCSEVRSTRSKTLFCLHRPGWRFEVRFGVRLRSALRVRGKGGECIMAKKRKKSLPKHEYKCVSHPLPRRY